MKKKIPILIPGQKLIAPRSVPSIATVKCLILVNGWLLLGHEAGDDFSGGKGLGWSLPGGATEETETAELIRRHIEELIIAGQNFGPGDDPFAIKETGPKKLALIREVLEEVGLLVTLEDQPALVEESLGGKHYTYVYRATSFRGQVMISEDELREVDAAGWFHTDALPGTKEKFREGWSLYPSEERRIRKICPQNKLRKTVWEETNVSNDDLHILVHSEKGHERKYGLNWASEKVVFAKRTIAVRDNESMRLCGITGKIFVSQDGVPEAPHLKRVYLHKRSDDRRFTIRHESTNKSFFHVQKLERAISILEISAADLGSRAVTYHKIIMPEGLESVDPDYRAMVLGVWKEREMPDAEPADGLVGPHQVVEPTNGTVPTVTREPLRVLTDADLELVIPEEIR